MRVVYFIASEFDYGLVIYPGVGAPFGKALGWDVQPISAIGQSDFDVGVIDPRLQAEDIPYIESYLSRPAARRRPIFFKVTDSDTPLSKHPAQRYSFEQGDRPGVHYAAAYEPSGPMRDFVDSLATSRVARLPFVYDVTREIDVPMEHRQRKVLLSGSQWRRFYPLRHKALMTQRWHPLGRLAVDVLPHPGYRDNGTRPLHDITHDKFVAKLAGYTHAFMCPGVFDSEFMKYVECAYAGCVPIGTAPSSIEKDVRDCFVDWRGGGLAMFLATRIGESEAQQRATAYRAAMKRLRDPRRVAAAFEQLASRIA